MTQVNLQELLMGDQAATLAQAGRSHTQTMSLLDKTSVKKYDEVDLLQAAAAKELGKAGLTTDLAGMREPALPAVKSG